MRSGCAVCAIAALLASGAGSCFSCDPPGPRPVNGIDGGGPGTGTDAGTAMPVVPRLRKPMNGSYLGSIGAPGSLRPTFTWEDVPVPGADVAAYELQYDVDPSFSAPTVVSSTTRSYRPPADLPVDAFPPVGARYFWRVRACGAGGCSPFSWVWSVNVGRSDRDFNGDAFADVVVGAEYFAAAVPQAGRVYVFFGAPGAVLDETPDVVLTGPGDALSFGRYLTSGDLNGDGFADLAVAYGSSDAVVGRARVFFGGPIMDAVADGILTEGEPGDFYGAATSSPGDLNGDVFADLAVADMMGRVYVYLGGAGSAFDPGADAVLAPGGPFGDAIAPAADVDGDGFGDLVVSSPDAGPDGMETFDGRVWVFRGGPGPSLDTVADLVVPGPAGAHLGAALSAGDFDDDGFSDVVAGAPLSDAGGDGIGRVYVAFGGPVLDGTPEGILAGSTDDYFGMAVAGLGDVDGDGFADLAVGTQDGGAVYVFRGGAGPAFDATVDALLSDPGPTYGRALAGAGDVNGDGLADVVAGANQNAGPANEGRVYVYFGSPPPLDVFADGTLTGENPGDFFGGSVH